MPKIALVIGIVLIVVGGWAFTASGPGASPTALIPALLVWCSQSRGSSAYAAVKYAAMRCTLPH